MILGTASHVGKSVVTAGLGRIFSDEGVRVAPFKAQNMSLNSAATPDGREIGRAQALQAEACRVAPCAEMNPVLIKPSSDMSSQIVLLGRVWGQVTASDYHLRRVEDLFPAVLESYRTLAARHDLMLLEGAGSPAEINLQATDIVNMRVAQAAGASTLLVCDIDRGGAFAHLYGTVELLPAEQRALIRGFVLNKFRGDARLLAPAPARLEELTGIPTVAVLPLWREHGLPEEDGVYDARPSGSGLSVAVLAYPYISNLDEFTPLRNIPGVSLSWAREAQTVASADLLVLPGSKHVAADLDWIRGRGLDAAIAAHVSSGKPTLAICGGLQLLGERLDDPHGVEGAARGLALMPYRTEFLPAKTYRHGHYALSTLRGFWEPLSGLDFDGYEIHHGITTPSPPPTDTAASLPALSGGGGWQLGQLLALYPHGLFEDPRVIKALFGAEARTLDDVMEGLADFVDRCFEPGRLMSYVEGPPQGGP